MVAAKKKTSKKKAPAKPKSPKALLADETRARRKKLKAKLADESFEYLEDLKSVLRDAISAKKTEAKALNKQYQNILDIEALVKAGKLDKSMAPTKEQIAKAKEVLKKTK